MSTAGSPRVYLPLKPPIRREQLRPGESLCDHCTGKCCRYFALPIEKPKSRADYDFARWYLLHGGATIFIDEGTWYLCVHSDCKHLLDDYRCAIYETRPQICRDYTTESCEYDDKYLYDQYFETAEQLWEYAEAMIGPPPEQGLRSPEPKGLAIVNV